MLPWSVMATAFCPRAATRSTSFFTSQAPSSSEYSVCKWRWVNSGMTASILVSNQLVFVRASTRTVAPVEENASETDSPFASSGFWTSIRVLTPQAAINKQNLEALDVVPKPVSARAKPVLPFTRRNSLEFLDSMPASPVVRIFREDRDRFFETLRQVRML